MVGLAPVCKVPKGNIVCHLQCCTQINRILNNGHTSSATTRIQGEILELLKRSLNRIKNNPEDSLAVPAIRINKIALLRYTTPEYSNYHHSSECVCMGLVLCRTQIFRVSSEYECRFSSIFEHEHHRALDIRTYSNIFIK